MKEFEINITTYDCPSKVNDLVSQFRNFLPNCFIRVWDNSPYFTKFERVDDIRWNKFNPSLSRIWNWAIGQSLSELVLITNDDIKLNNEWLEELQSEVNDDLLWYGPSRHFIFNKKLIDLVGWFDERLVGFTYEDLDYVRRMNQLGIKMKYGSESSLARNAISLKNMISRELHPCGNKEFMNDKYGEHNLEDFNVIPKFSTPDFYPLSRV